MFGSGGEHLHSLPSLEANVVAMTWAADPRQDPASSSAPLTLAAADSTSIHTWLVNQDTVVNGWTMPAGVSSIQALAASPNGALLAAAGQGAVRSRRGIAVLQG